MTRDELIKQRILSELEKEDIMSDPRNNTMNFTSGIRLAKKIVSKVEVDQPPTLADLLGWEERQEYEYRTGVILMVDNGKIYFKSDECSSGWCNYTFYGYEIEDLRQAKKVEPKYYAKIKGWEVFNDGYYWNYDEEKKYFFINSKYETERTKSQWAELGINEDNADFERVEKND